MNSNWILNKDTTEIILNECDMYAMAQACCTWKYFGRIICGSKKLGPKLYCLADAVMKIERQLKEKNK